jgi:hypothetical protein
MEEEKVKRKVGAFGGDRTEPTREPNPSEEGVYPNKEPTKPDFDEEWGMSGAPTEDENPPDENPPDENPPDENPPSVVELGELLKAAMGRRGGSSDVFDFDIFEEEDDEEEKE